MIRKAVLTLSTVLLVVAQINGQEKQLVCVLIDSLTSSPVSDAHIMSSENRGTISDQSGFFELVVKDFPVELRVTHIHYGTHVFEFDTPPKEKVWLRIQAQTEHIGEVNITGQRIRVINRTNEYNISDFAFDDDHLWLLGNYLNKRSEPRLWLSSSIGDTICSIPVATECHLENDVFHNVHLFSGDTAIQLSALNHEIHIVDKLSVSKYNSILRPIKAFFSDKLVYSKYLPGQEGLHFYYQAKGDPDGKFLACIRDTIEEAIQEYEYVYGQAGSVIRAMMNSSGVSSLMIRMSMIARMKNKDNVINKKIYAPLCGSKSHLIITNVYQDSLLIYDKNGKLINSIKHKLSNNYGTFGKDYTHLSFLIDNKTQNIYLLMGEWDHRQLFHLNIKTSELERIQIPNEISHQEIVIYDQAFYVLKPEKNYPYYTRLYRIRIAPD